MTDGAFTILSLPAEEGCDFACSWPAYVVVLVSLLHVFVPFVMLVHFNRRFRAISWEPLEPAPCAHDVEDPFYRLLSKVRVRLLSRGYERILIDRPTGEFARSEDDLMGTPLSEMVGLDLGRWSFVATPYFIALFAPLALCTLSIGSKYIA